LIALKLIVALGVVLILKILFPSIIKGIRRIIFLLVIAMTIFAIVVMYSP